MRDADFQLICPACYMTVGGGTVAWGEADKPFPGAFAVCDKCATILRFTKDIQLRIAEDKDFDGAPMDFVEAMAEVVASVKGHIISSGAKPRDHKMLN